MTADDRRDVIVVGAGPTGLAAATLLGQYGLRVAVVERYQDVYPLPRGVHLDDEVYRILHRLGIGEAFAAHTRPAAGLRLVDDRHRVLATFTRHGATPAGIPQANMFDQPALERLLRDRLESLPQAEILGGHEMVRLDTSDAGSVGARLRRPDGSTVDLRAPYVVACDGANSAVRGQLGIGDDDLGFDQRWLVVDVRCALDLDAWDGVHQVCDPHRAGTYMRVGQDRYRWEFRLLDGENASDFEGIPDLRPLIGPWTRTVPDTGLELLRCTEYTFRARVARRWRDGRVFLAGDAAHVTPPFIGQGLCTGLRDAYNLAWKLAAVLRADADPALLDSYEEERRPHATTMIRRAKGMGQLMTGGGRIASLARRHLIPALARSQAVRRTLLDSRTPPLTPGTRISRSTPRAVRGALLPLVRLAGPGGEPVLVDEILGERTTVVALPGTDLAAVPGGHPSAWLTVDPGGDGGERLLARWLLDAGVGWVRVDPDRVVGAAGPARWAR
ncbi:bifunctional 3-(3-hydroxy-phenyl)propionate/3-hydroxycinnamic acid hydroxylase [Streptomyces sp. SID5785]|uniref:bifunctional 3-(3-hydroxy-phenyl)propionate/3-hydroxycinnamic acid hydroxylase n=1 Tax=Streptomyces sp. SID5785 TaxID=2690309 RepID=UPI001360E31E|nr:bifunctional 3-(3-hydroxy-phenyl)propionate/3-hydroxycinnamic acid hydroxylase [Streptomyces sp. SID5785]MZD10005.1 bifunctional 3-(3-hydroxy-phenyl)propionate/3-hydroxycinnamic acid hydroxylase [Streptomyces sp. SID5785]